MSRVKKLVNWSPWNVLLQHCTPENYGIVILNRPIHFQVDNKAIIKIWNEAKIRITVDGGTDRWLQWLKSQKIAKNLLANPELITGDMDSISEATLNYFKEFNETKIVYTKDQNETDFTKALLQLQKYCQSTELHLDSVMVLSQWSGRFDQIISNVNTLYKASKILPNLQLFILCEDSLTWLLNEGEHSIVIPQKLIDDQLCCGLLPIGSPARVTTTGLKWNLNKRILEFGDLVSSSNTYSDGDVVTVNTDRPIIWTMQLTGLF